MSKPINFFQFIFSRLFLIQFLISIVLLFGILYGVLLYLDHYTLHGEEITVPDIIGVHKDDLKNVLEEKDLNYKIIDSVFVLDAEKGIVIGQNPDPLSKVKKDRIIYITVNAMNPPSVTLPLLIDKSLRQAKSIIENVGLKLDDLVYRPDQCVNCVLAMKIGGVEMFKDTIVPKGTMVELVLGGGLSNEKTLVPLLINLNREEAIERLKKSFLNLGAEVYDGSIFDAEDSVNAKIFVQYPSYGAQSWLRLGSSVDIEYTLLDTKIDTNIVILDSSLLIPYEPDSL